jgi:hypothetical protein
LIDSSQNKIIEPILTHNLGDLKNQISGSKNLNHHGFFAGSFMKFTGSLKNFKIRDSKDFQKTWNWRCFDSESFQKPKTQRVFEKIQKPETRGALLLRVFKTPEPEVL